VLNSPVMSLVERTKAALRLTRTVVLDEARLAGRALLLPFLVAWLVSGLAFSLLVLVDMTRQDEPASSVLGMAVAGLVYGLFVAFCPSFVLGGLNLVRHFAGWSVLVPLVALPLGLAIGLLVVSPLLDLLAHQWVVALFDAGTRRDWASDHIGVGVHSPLMLVFLLPLLLYDLGAIALDPFALMILAALLLTVVVGIALGTAPAAALSLAVVVRGVVVRFQRRAEARADTQ
jgi:hypothetical protein